MKVTLRQERKEGDCRFLGAEIKDNGDLVFEGQDLGPSVERFYGRYEYEWYWTVKEPDIATFQKALGGAGNILELLEQHFSNQKAADLYQFMQDNSIPFSTWSRIGD